MKAPSTAAARSGVGLRYNERAMVSVVRFVLVTLFIVAVPIFLIASNVRWVINAPILYSFGFDKYDIPSYVSAVTGTRIERDELLSAAEQIRGYFNNNEEFLVVRVFVDGVRVQNLHKEREVLHMRDVKGLVKGVYRIQEAAGAFIGVFIVLGLLAWRRVFARLLLRYVAYGGVLTLVLVVAVGLASLVGFERLFLAFHLVSFSNDFWVLDPRTHYLLAMFPEAFFFDATMWIAGSTVVEALLLALPLAILKLRSRRARPA